jgi:hypothetical protein
MDPDAAEKVKARRVQTALYLLVAVGVLLPLALYFAVHR